MEVNDSDRSLFGFGDGNSNRRDISAGDCWHCGLPVKTFQPPGGLVSDLPKSGSNPETEQSNVNSAELLGPAPEFCCTGCAVAYEAIRLAGLDHTYYSLRHLSAEALGIPAKPSTASALSKQQIVSERFLEQSTKQLKNGNRQVCLAIDGLTCAACGWLAEQVVVGQHGMQGASVNLPDATLTFEFDPSKASLEKLLDTLARFGYELHPRNERPEGPSPQERKLLIKVGVSWALAGNIMLLAFALYSGLTLESDRTLATAARWASLLIATGAVAYGGSVFFRTAAASLRMAFRNRSLKRLHIDTPISLGIIVGYLNSAWATIAGRGDVWFDSIAVLIAALLTARWLQTRSQRTATQAASRLLDMVPSTARRILADGTEDYVASADLESGETIRVDPGEVVPVDGSILAGRSSINTAVITGESLPVSVEPGDTVFAGSINQSTPIVVKAESSGRNTRVGQLLEWLEESTRVQAPVVQTADRISAAFVLVILAAAIGTGVVGILLFPESALHRVVALLVISCPCALGMSTPLAIAAANGKAARRGIYIKDGATVEALARVSTVVFDKTGTLTEGNLALLSFNGSDDVLLVAAAIEQYSRHPVAQSFVRAVEDRFGFETALPIAVAVESISGFGIRGVVGGRTVIVGRPDWVAEQVASDSTSLETISAIIEKAQTPIAIAIDNHIVATAGCGDQIREQSAREVKKLVDSGITVMLLSGDHQEVVNAVARQVGISKENAFGAIGPEEKRQIVQRIANRLPQSETVLMIGDGANDAAALRTADVGVAVGNNNAPCLVASDIFLPSASGASVAPLLVFGKRVLRLINRNLGVSLAYNVIAGAAAMLGFVTPLVAAIAMPLSSLFVVSTSVAIRPFATEQTRAGRTHPKQSAIGPFERRAPHSPQPKMV